MTDTHQLARPLGRSERFPLGGLLALAAAGFITIMLETLPAGVLPAMSRSLGVSESAAGQTVTVFAIGSIAGAIPLITATMGWPRRRLLLLALGGYAVTSVATAASDSFTITLLARFVAGLFAGVLWGILAGFARRMVTPEHRGRALTIALAGIPLALAIGTPAATLLAGAAGWRLTFGSTAVIALVLIVWVRLVVPDFPGQERGVRVPVGRVFSIPGVVPAVVVTVLFVMAHNVFYTYIAAFLGPIGLGESVSAVLLVFGVFSLVSLGVTGLLIDRHLRRLMIGSTALFAFAMLALALLADVPAAVFVSAALWGLAFGGASSLLQTAAADAAGADAVDIAQSVLVTGWNLGIAGGGILGGLLLSGWGATSLAWVTGVLVLGAMIVTVGARRHAFP